MNTYVELFMLKVEVIHKEEWEDYPFTTIKMTLGEAGLKEESV
jgi:hypothetical protein